MASEDKKPSLLEQRAQERAKFHDNRREEMRNMRDADPSKYLEQLKLANMNGTMGSLKREKPAPKEKQDKEPSRLVQEMRAMGAKLNNNRAEIEGKRQEKENAAREARTRDLSAKADVKRDQQQTQNFQMISGVFKDQGEKMVKAIKDLEKKLAEGKESGGGGEEGGKSLLEEYQDFRKNKRKKNRQRRRDRSGGGRSPRGARGTLGGAGGGDDLDIEDFDDAGADDRNQSRRDAKRNRRMKRLRAARAGRGGSGLRGAWNRARGFGSNLIGGASGAAEGAAGAAGRGAGLGSKVLSAGGKVLSVGSKVLGAAGGLAAAGEAAYNSVPLIGKVFDSNESTASRIGAGAHLATTAAGGVIGGVLGGPVGAAYGAYAGDKVAEGAEWLGQQIADSPEIQKALTDKDGIVQRTGAAIGSGVDSAGSAISSGIDAVRTSAFGKVLGVQAAIAMSPFSEEARKSLKQDWEQTILPKFEESFDFFTNKLGNYTTAISQAGGQILDGVKNAGKSAWQGVKDAGGQIADGYKKGGVGGALKAVGGGVGTVGAGIGKGLKDIKAGVSSAGSTLNYASQKGTSNTLDLALGFKAKEGFKGMSDSESKAYAANVMKTESGGALGITNQYGFAGQYQFGADALSDNGLIDKQKLAAAKKASGADWYKGGGHKKFLEDNSNWKNEGGRDAFLKDKQLQDDTFVKYTNKNIEAGYKSGALTANSSAGDIAGYAKASHLKGAGGANDYFLRGKDSTDANGTKVSDYAKGASDSLVSLASKVDAAKKEGKLGPDAVKTQVASASTAKKDANGNVVVSSDPTAKKPAVAGAVPTGQAAVTAPKTLAEAAATKPDQRTTSVAGVRMTAAGDAVKPTSDTSYAVTPVTTSTAPTAKAVSAAVPLVAASTPTESQSVTVSNPTPPSQPSNTTVVAGGGGKQSGAPSLQDMPIMINDMGLVLLNIGHV